MKILHLINYFNDGLNYQENFLTKYQADDGHMVQVITSDRFYPFENYNKIYHKLLGNRLIDKRKYKIEKVEIIRKKAYFESKKHAQCLFFNLYDIYKFNPDVVHIHNTGTITFITAFLYCSFFKKKLFIDCHSDFQNTNQNFIKQINNFFWKIFYYFFKNTINKFLPINQSSKDFIINNYKVKENKIEIIPLGYEKFKKIKNLEIKKIRNRLKFNNDDIIIFNSGKIKKDKKILDLIRLLEFLLRYNKKFKLLLVGEASGEYSLRLKKKVISLNSRFKNVINWIGFQKINTLRDLMCISDIAIWPGIPSISIQEAVYCNNILFLPKTSASYHLVNEETLTFYNKNIFRTSQNLLNIFKRRDLKKNILAKNIAKLNKFNWISISKKFLNIYENN